MTDMVLQKSFLSDGKQTLYVDQVCIMVHYLPLTQQSYTKLGGLLFWVLGSWIHKNEWFMK